MLCSIDHLLGRCIGLCKAFSIVPWKIEEAAEYQMAICLIFASQGNLLIVMSKIVITKI